MRWLSFAVAVLMTPTAAAHPHSEHGNVYAPVASELAYQTGALFLCEDTTICHLPNGVPYYKVFGVEGGDHFTITPDDALEGPPSCDTPRRPDGESTPEEGLAVVDATTSDPGWWFCTVDIDFDIHFTGGPYRNDWGPEAGTVPGTGDALVTLLFQGDVGEGFTYEEA